MKPENPYKKYVDEILGKAFESMGVKPHKRYPRKEKKRMKKCAANAIGWKAWKQYEAENKPLKEMVGNAIKEDIQKTFVYFEGKHLNTTDLEYNDKS